MRCMLAFVIIEGESVQCVELVSRGVVADLGRYVVGCSWAKYISVYQLHFRSRPKGIAKEGCCLPR